MMINRAVVAAIATFCWIVILLSIKHHLFATGEALLSMLNLINKYICNPHQKPLTTTTKNPTKFQGFTGLCRFEESQICGLHNWDWCRSYSMEMSSTHAPRCKTYNSMYRSNCTSFQASQKILLWRIWLQYISSITWTAAVITLCIWQKRLCCA